jgi:hypothetical protein
VSATKKKSILLTVRLCLKHQQTLEWSASIATLSGQAIGSTTLQGALIYALANVLWWRLTIRSRMWGLLPLNVAGAAITAWTLFGLL